MQALVVYDSQFGNTQKVAEVIAKELGPKTKIYPVKQVTQVSVDRADLIVVGTPTHGGRATQALSEWINQLDTHVFKQKIFACFDTRIPMEAVTQKWLLLVLKLIGYAAPKLERVINSKGGTLACKSQGFLVEDKEGPLYKGELTRAKKWAKQLAGF